MKLTVKQLLTAHWYGDDCVHALHDALVEDNDPRAGAIQECQLWYDLLHEALNSKKGPRPNWRITIQRMFPEFLCPVPQLEYGTRVYVCSTNCYLIGLASQGPDSVTIRLGQAGHMYIAPGHRFGLPHPDTTMRVVLRAGEQIRKLEGGHAELHLNFWTMDPDEISLNSWDPDYIPQRATRFDVQIQT